MSEQNHEDLVFGLHARGEIPEYFFDALPRRTALDELRIDLGLLREINNVVLRNAVLPPGRLNEGRRPFVKPFAVFRITADAGDDDQMGFLREQRARNREEHY